MHYEGLTFNDGLWRSNIQWGHLRVNVKWCITRVEHSMVHYEGLTLNDVLWGSTLNGALWGPMLNGALEGLTFNGAPLHHWNFTVDHKHNLQQTGNSMMQHDIFRWLWVILNCLLQLGWKCLKILRILIVIVSTTIIMF